MEPIPSDSQPRQQSPSHLEQSFNARIERHFSDPSPDVLAQFLIDKRNPGTRKAYEKDLNDFFRSMTGKPATRDSVLEFLHLDRSRAVAVVLNYKALLFKKGLSEATVNRRLAAIKSLAAMGRKLGVCHFTLEDVKGEKVQQYRDTSGISPDAYRRVYQQCERSTLKGKRDYALLKLLWDNALRRNMDLKPLFKNKSLL